MWINTDLFEKELHRQNVFYCHPIPQGRQTDPTFVQTGRIKIQNSNGELKALSQASQDLKECSVGSPVTFTMSSGRSETHTRLIRPTLTRATARAAVSKLLFRFLIEINAAF